MLVAITSLIGLEALAQNPQPNWKDSYSVGGKCYCDSSNFDHGLDKKTALTPIGELNVVVICADIKSAIGEGPTADRIPYNDIQCGNGPANDAADETECPGRVDMGSAGCNIIGPKWDLVSVYGPWPGTTPTPEPSPIVNTPPSVNFATPAANEVFDLGENPAVYVLASDDGSISNVKLYLDDAFVRQENQAPYQWSNTATNDPSLKNLVPGTYKLTALAEDNSGLTTETSTSFTIRSSDGGCELPWTNSGFSVSNETRTFSSGQIDISCASNLTLSMDVEGTGPMEPADYINVFYELDSGQRITVSQDTDAFSKKTLSTPNLNGSTLEIIIEAKTSTASEVYTVSNMRVTVEGSTGTVNLALGKSVTQSSLDWGGDPERAIDGNTSGIWNQGSITHTNNESQPWWEIDLGSVSDISHVDIWNRTNCCSGRLSDFYVFVSDAPFASQDLTTTLNQSGVSHFYYGPTAGSPTQININRTGRYMRVQLSGSNPLSIAEFQVFGSN